MSTRALPVLQLDDLVVVLRNALDQQGQFGCTINPRQENLAATKSFQESWQGRVDQAVAA